MVEINIYLLLALNVILSIVITLATSYLKEMGKNLALKQMKGKLTEIDENIKKQIETKNRLNETQKQMLIDFHSECDNLIFETLKLHDTLFHHIFVENLIPKINLQVTKLNTTISSLNLFFDDNVILNKAKDLNDSLINLSAYRKDSIQEYNFLKNYKEEKMSSLSSFNNHVIDKDSETSKTYKEELSSEIGKIADRERKLYYEAPEKLKEYYEIVKHNKKDFELTVRKRILSEEKSTVNKS